MGDNIATMFAYNRNSIKARDILSKAYAEDIGQDVIDCILAVDVRSACFKEQMTRNGFHRPYMEVSGEVPYVFIEEDDARYFPCGTKRIDLKTPEKVRILYVISTTELHDLVNMGFYCPDFKIPDHLVNNIIEIPAQITYTCIYDTPICIVDINNKTRIETSTRVNHYDGIFSDGCQVSKQRAMEEFEDYDFSMQAYYYSDEPMLEPEQAAVYDIEDDIADNKSDDTIAVSDKNRYNRILSINKSNTEQMLLDKYDDMIKKNEQNNENKQQLAKADKSVIESIVNSADAIAKKQAAHDKISKIDSMDIYAQLLGSDDTDTSSVTVAEPTYDTFLEAMKKLQLDEDLTKVNMLDNTKSEKDAKDSREAARKVDVALDNQALNRGETDIAGQAHASDSVVETSNEATMTDDQKKKMQEKKARDAARKVDVALDNQVLNRGETDIAGQAHADNKNKENKENKETKKEVNDTMDFFSSLLGDSDNHDSPNFF